MSLAALLGEPELNEHQKAWYSGDAKKIKALAETFKVPKDQVLFKIIDELMVGKRRIQVNEIEEYDQNMINSALSQHPDLAYHAEVMNSMIASDRKEHLSNQMHFDYLWVSIRRGKRARVKWAKSSSSEDKLIIACISELFQLSEMKATEYFREFGEEDISNIKRLSKAFATTEDFLNRKFTLPKSVIAEMQTYAHKW